MRARHILAVFVRDDMMSMLGFRGQQSQPGTASSLCRLTSSLSFHNKLCRRIPTHARPQLTFLVPELQIGFTLSQTAGRRWQHVIPLNTVTNVDCASSLTLCLAHQLQKCPRLLYGFISTSACHIFHILGALH